MGACPGGPGCLRPSPLAEVPAPQLSVWSVASRGPPAGSPCPVGSFLPAAASSRSSCRRVESTSRVPGAFPSRPFCPGCPVSCSPSSPGGADSPQRPDSFVSPFAVCTPFPSCASSVPSCARAGGGRPCLVPGPGGKAELLAGQDDACWRLLWVLVSTSREFPSVPLRSPPFPGPGSLSRGRGRVFWAESSASSLQGGQRREPGGDRTALGARPLWPGLRECPRLPGSGQALD